MKGSGYGFIGDVVIGIIGGVIGGWLFRVLGIGLGGGIIGAIIAAVIGADDPDPDHPRGEKGLTVRGLAAAGGP